MFRAVANAQSFTQAAQRLGLDKARVSRQVAALEAVLRRPLFSRSTRSMRLTPEGHALLHQVNDPLDALYAAARVDPAGDEPHGDVVVATTPEVARALLGPALGAFRVRYPKVRVQLHVSAAVETLAEVDVALRVGRTAPSQWVVTKLRELESGFFAAPSYVERRGLPTQLADLAQHEGLWPIPPRGAKAFSPSGGARAVPRPAVACADFQVLASLASASAGVALLPTFLAERDVAEGRLVRVLPEFTLGAAPLMLLTPPKRQLTERARALATHLRRSLGTR